MLSAHLQANNRNPHSVTAGFTDHPGVSVTFDLEKQASENGTSTSFVKSYESADSMADSSVDTDKESDLYSSTQECSYESEDLQERCHSFYFNGFCMKGAACEFSHIEQTVSVNRLPRRSKLAINFPEILPEFRNKRVLSFFQ